MASTLDETKLRMRRAVESVEARSSAEIMVAVRPSAATYLAADLIAGAGLAYLVLLYTLYAPQVFDLHWIALLMPTSMLLGVAAVRAVPWLRLRLAGRAVERALHDTARALFVDLGVSCTRERTGILVLVAQLERRCVVLADYGVMATVPEDAWREIVRRIERSFGAGPASFEALAEAIEAAGDVLAQHLPRREDDANELAEVAW